VVSDGLKLSGLLWTGVGTANRSLDGTGRKEHGYRRRASVGLPFDGVDRKETVSPVEVDRVRLGVDHDTDASKVVRHSEGEQENESEQPTAEPLVANSFIDGETGEPKHGERVSRQLLARGGR
jgi:hypothetical protein